MAKLIEITGKPLSGEWGTDDETGAGIPVLRTTNFTNEGVVSYENVVTRIITKKNISEKYLRPGDIILEKSGGSDKQPVGRVIYYDGPLNTYLFNNFTGLLRVQDQKKWYPRYVFYSLFSNYRKGGTRAFENKTTGLHNLKADDYVSRYEVTNAAYSLQVEICDRLDRIAGIIELRKQELQQLDDLIKARFVELFGDQGKNPFGLDVGTLKDVADIYLGLTHTPTYVEKGKPFLSVRDISSGTIDFSKCHYITEEEFESLPKGARPIANDLLFCRVGTIGKPVIIPEGTPEFGSFVSVGFLRKKDNVLNEYLKSWMEDPYFMKQVLDNVAGASQINLNTGWLKNFKILIPPIELQKQFAEFVKQVDKSKVAVQKALDKAQLLFDSLMQKYFG